MTNSNLAILVDEEDKNIQINSETPLFKLFEISTDMSASEIDRENTTKELIERAESYGSSDPARVEIVKHVLKL